MAVGRRRRRSGSSPAGIASAAVLVSLSAACLGVPGSLSDSADASPAGDAGPADGGVGEELLQNPGFDLGPVDWALSGGARIGTSAELEEVTPDSGEYLAELGRDNDATESIAQILAVPAWAVALRVTGQRCYSSDQTGGEGDEIDFILRDGAGVALEVLDATTSVDIGTVCDWSSFELVPTEPHAGESIQFEVRATTDASLVTTFRLDTLSVRALAP